MPAREPTYDDATAVPAPARPSLRGIVETETCVVGGDLAGDMAAFYPGLASARFGLPFAGGPLGRIPAQAVHWRAERAARLGQVSAHE